jgi:hypothetical protein
MEAHHVVLMILCIGFLLMGVGFSWQEREWGVRLIAVGMLGMFGPIFYRLIYMMP